MSHYRTQLWGPVFDALKALDSKPQMFELRGSALKVRGSAVAVELDEDRVETRTKDQDDVTLNRQLAFDVVVIEDNAVSRDTLCAEVEKKLAEVSLPGGEELLLGDTDFEVNAEGDRPRFVAVLPATIQYDVRAKQPGQAA